MQFVPYYFCESVCALLKTELAELDLLCRNDPDCTFWSSAIESDFANRPTFSLQIRYSGEPEMSCEIGHSSLFDISLDVLKAACQRQNYRLKDICFGSISAGPWPAAIANVSSEETTRKVQEIIKFTASYIHRTEIKISNLFKQDKLDYLLEKAFAVYEKRSFQTIHIFACNNLYEEFLGTQLKSDHLKALEFSGDCFDTLPRQIEEFALTKTFHCVELYGVNFDFDFFKKLFKKPLGESRKCYFKATIDDFNLKNELREFEKNYQLSSTQNEASWRRTDGVVVTVRLDRFEMTFSQS